MLQPHPSWSGNALLLRRDSPTSLSELAPTQFSKIHAHVVFCKTMATASIELPVVHFQVTQFVLSNWDWCINLGWIIAPTTSSKSLQESKRQGMFKQFQEKSNCYQGIDDLTNNVVVRGNGHRSKHWPLLWRLSNTLLDHIVATHFRFSLIRRLNHLSRWNPHMFHAWVGVASLLRRIVEPSTICNRPHHGPSNLASFSPVLILLSFPWIVSTLSLLHGQRCVIVN